MSGTEINLKKVVFLKTNKVLTVHVQHTANGLFMKELCVLCAVRNKSSYRPYKTYISLVVKWLTFSITCKWVLKHNLQLSI